MVGKMFVHGSSAPVEHENYRTSFMFILPVPRASGFGWLAAGFHPICDDS